MIVSFDLETAIIRPGLLAPPVTCMTFASLGEPGNIVHHTGVRDVMKTWLLDPGISFVGQNIAFDFGCICEEYPDLLPLVFEAYDADRVTDTKIRAQLLDIAAGLFAGWPEGGKWVKPKYSLYDLAKRFTSRSLVKDDWRMFYAEFRDVPLDRWVAHARDFQERSKADLARAETRVRLDPKNKEKKFALANLKGMIASDPQRVIDYAVEDAVVTLEIYETQEVHKAFLENQFEQARSGFWHHLMSAWGFRTSPEGVEKLRQATVKAHGTVQTRLIQAGIVRPDGSRDIKAAAAHMKSVCYRAGIPVRLTEKGNVVLDADACEASEDPAMADYALLTSYGNILQKDIPMLLAGTVTPVQSRFDLAATGRDTSSKPNVQNLRSMTIETDDDELSIRESFVPREGWCFIQGDWPALELHTHAQSSFDMFGESKLGEMINDGIDPHTAFAAQLESITYEEALECAKDKSWMPRKIAKVFNFGLPGGMGDKKFKIYLRNAGIELDIKTIQYFRAVWKKTFPEMQKWFDMAAKECKDGEGIVMLPRSKRRRGGLNYTSWCNTWFQAPGSDCMKRTGWCISKECYVDKRSPLFGSRIVNIVHDEFILETRLGPGAHDAAMRLSRLMAEGANEFVPDCPFEDIEVLLMNRWAKGAKPVHDSEGRLVPWT